MHIVPDFPVTGMEYMGTIFMYLNTCNIFGINIACNVITSIDNQATKTMFRKFVGKNGTI